ncbi:MAG TPA: ribose-phosphate pyrophosphokinase [Candidatus Tumulicola sp.]|nr:ribose-phosphate pyrophosphokinase [Candidatus Tumulicola sp.]
MELAVFCGSANEPLGRAIAEGMGARLGRRTAARFPDGESHVEVLDSVRGRDVYLVQPTSPPTDENLMELLLLADACRRAGAARITAIVPYLGYARQDRRSKGREGVGARLVADMLATAGIERIVCVDLHSSSIEGMSSVPIEHVSAARLIADAVAPLASKRSVVVAPDLGAVKLAERYARYLDLPLAVVHKVRLSGEEVEVRGIIGDVAGLSPVIVDDMITTGVTIEAAVGALLRAGCNPAPIVAATHALLVGDARRRLRELSVTCIATTDSIAAGPDDTLPMRVIGLGALLSVVAVRLHENKSLADYLGR